MNRRILSAILVCGCIGLTGCGADEMSRDFGMTRDAPDEFTVTTRAPLSMPPDYQLRPPRPGASRPQELSSQQGAEEALAPQIALEGTGGRDSAGQDALLRQAGRPAPRDVRAQVDAAGKLDHPSESFADRLMFWRAPYQNGTLVDARGESQRLRQNAALGQAPQAGDTPIIVQKRSGGFLDALF